MSEFSILLSRAIRSDKKAVFRRRAEHLALSVMVVLLLWFPVHMSIRFNRNATMPDTGSYAGQWIFGHYPPDTHFAVERYTPVLDPERFKITKETRLINRAVRDYRDAGVEYLIVSEIIYNRYSSEHRQTKNYQKLFRICPLVREFKPVPGKLTGPIIRILRVPPP